MLSVVNVSCAQLGLRETQHGAAQLGDDQRVAEQAGSSRRRMLR